MSTTQNYPSPTHAASGGDGGPFYHQRDDSEPIPLTQEVPDDLQLRADLARSLGGPFGDSHEQPSQDHDLSGLSPQHYEGAHGDAHDHLAQSVLGLHEVSPIDRQSLGAQGRQKDQRQKVSRACDECRRKKVCHCQHRQQELVLSRHTDQVRRARRKRIRSVLELQAHQRHVRIQSTAYEAGPVKRVRGRHVTSRPILKHTGTSRSWQSE